MDVDVVIQLVQEHAPEDVLVFEIHSPFLCELQAAPGAEKPEVLVGEDCSFTMDGESMSRNDFYDMIYEDEESGAIVARVIGRLKLLATLEDKVQSMSPVELIALIRKEGWSGDHFRPEADTLYLVAHSLEVIHNGRLEGVPSYSI